ncbi:double-strand break repair protein AddB [Amylibacter marinus]|uniref:Double-strand break repair protein AddB n=1 Tax=Amylibacter marinus TaxID=1475483 RepID=A0ABQ5VW15_9RHOB|nr:double-strand break repair protein AddB [Amylibacter marinus]GLQ35615.1 double-strand break repair protein AddB [Amylibacter marinus]
MFNPQQIPRVFAQPLGCDFSQNLVDGLITHMADTPPEAMARVDLYVNTQRMKRRVQEIFYQRGAGFLPRIRLITSLSDDPLMLANLPEAAPSLRRQLLLGQLIQQLLQAEPSLAPISATYDLVQSLSALMDEVQGEGVTMADVVNLDVAEHSEHWGRSKRFLEILANYWDQNALTDPQDRMRHISQLYAQIWAQNPPQHPVIIAGSTGSRGETAAFMQAVANLPQGAVILPGVEPAEPAHLWHSFKTPSATLDHPQAGFAKLFEVLGIERSDAPVWYEAAPANPARNALISLALRPAPMTDQWMQEGPDLIPQVTTATQDITMIEADVQKEEALAIAICLRNAAEQEQKAVLITPNRTLTRRVSANLARWGIEADDSAGVPLQLTPPGVFLRSIAGLFGRPLAPQNLSALLKHTLCHSTEARPEHNLMTQRLEVAVLRGGPPFVSLDTITHWADGKKSTPEQVIWAAWIARVFAPLAQTTHLPLAAWIDLHFTTAEALAAGPSGEGSGILWDKAAGRRAREVMDELRQEQAHGGHMSAIEYQSLIARVLSTEVRRDAQFSHPNIAIWGTLEARVQGADLVILGGLNEGIWPENPKPDMWLNRDMRKQLGLLLPERSIGLSAHDFQQAMGAARVVISRCLRDGEALANPSRWLMRLTNLLEGIGDTGKEAVRDMRQRGDQWVRLARLIDLPVHSAPAIAHSPPAPRPAPVPPKGARIDRLSVTQVQRLIRNPYEIYARRILGLRKLEPLGKQPDALARGIAVHAVLEQFSTEYPHALPEEPRAAFLASAEKVLARSVPWPSARHLWLARLAQVADWFLAAEATRRRLGVITATERSGELYFKELDFTLSVQADRLDQGQKGLRIYDYKAGKPPTSSVVKVFDRQLHLTALIAVRGGMDGMPGAPVEHLEFIGMHSDQTTLPIDVDDETIVTTEDELKQLIGYYNIAGHGFNAHDKEQLNQDIGDFDHLSRRGEWTDSDAPEKIEISDEI